jgi:hypothetical protein
MEIIRLNTVRFAYPVYENLIAVDTNAKIIADWLNDFKPRYSMMFDGREGKKPISLFCRGTSGIIIASAVKRLLKGPSDIRYIRKETESRHEYGHGGVDSDNINIVIDDFIASGLTMKKISDELGCDKTNIHIVCIRQTIGEEDRLLELFPNTKILLTD